MNIQLCGQVSGRDYDEAVAEFREAERAVRERHPGAFVFNPVHHVRRDASHEDAMRWCLRQLTCFTDLMVMLPGWERSKGACLEVAVAQAVGVEVRDLAEVV